MREHDTKTAPVFLSADGEACCLLLPSSIQPYNTYSRILKVTGQV